MGFSSKGYKNLLGLGRIMRESALVCQERENRLPERKLPKITES